MTKVKTDHSLKVWLNKRIISHFSRIDQSFIFQEPAGIFELIEVVGNGTYGQVYKVSALKKFLLLVSRIAICAQSNLHFLVIALCVATYTGITARNTFNIVDSII